MRWIDYGLSVIQREVVVEEILPDEPVDLATVYSKLSDEGRLAGFEVDQRFYEIGSPEGLRELEALLRGSPGVRQ